MEELFSGDAFRQAVSQADMPAYHGAMLEFHQYNFLDFGRLYNKNILNDKAIIYKFFHGCGEK